MKEIPEIVCCRILMFTCVFLGPIPGCFFKQRLMFADSEDLCLPPQERLNFQRGKLHGYPPRRSKHPMFKDSDPKNQAMAFGTRDRKYWVLGPCGPGFCRDDAESLQ